MRANPSSWFLAGCALLLLIVSVCECLRRYQRSYGMFPAGESWKGYFYEPPAIPTTKKEIERVPKAVRP